MCRWRSAFYYISIMICIFLVLWFLLYWMEHRASGYRAWIRFAWYSLLAGATGAVLILPTAKVLSLSGASGISFPETMEWYFIGAGAVPSGSRCIHGRFPLAQSVLRNFCALSAVSVCVEQSGSMEEKTAKTGTRRVFLA